MKTSQRGFIALISAVIISTVLLTLAVSIGSSTFFARFDALNHEYKRLSLGFAESCVTTALGKIGADYNYSASNVLVSLGTLYGKPAECTIAQVAGGTPINGKKPFTITAKANFNNAFSTITTQVTAQDPTLAPVTPPPTCAFNPSAVSVPGGSNVPFAWSTAGTGITSFTMDRGVGSLSPFTSGSWSFTAPVSAGTYTYTGTVVNAGGQSTCNIIVTVTPPPPAPSCSDTVMMFDRSGSMSGTDLSNERNAGNALTNLYAGVSSLPKIGAGSFGGLDGSYASIPVNGLLTSSYSTILSTIATITGSNSSVGSNLGAAITVGAAELASGRHTPGKQKVFIFVSDGVPNEPTNSAGMTGTSSPSANVQNGSGDLWTLPANAYANASGEATDAGGHRHRFSGFGFPTIPTGSTIRGIMAEADAWSIAVPTAASTTLIASQLGAYDQWSANTGTRISATQTNDGDTSYIDTAASVETFDFASAGIPATALVNSVTLTASAKGTASGALLQLVAENGGAPNIGSSNALTTGYATYTRAMTTNPLTGNAWTAAEANAWSTSFGVRTTNTTPSVRVTQLSATVNFTPLTPGTSGQRTPAATHTPNNWDTNAVGNVQSSNNIYASDGGDGDQQGYSNFGFSVPANATITGIDVAAEAKSSDTSGCEFRATLSANGTTFSAPNGPDTLPLTGTDATLTFGGATDTWGRTWTPAEVNSNNLTVRVEGVDPGSSCSNGSVTSLDHLRVNVSYTTPGSATNVTVSPASIGGYDQWSTNTTDVASVATNDNDTSYLHNATSVETFLPANAAVPAGSTINAVTLTAVARGTAAGSAIQLVVENGGAPNTAGNNNPLTTSYATYTRAMTTNPFTGNPWAVADVNAWTTRFGVQAASGIATPRVTQLMVKVDYTAPATSSGCQLGVDLSWDGGTTWTPEKTATLTGAESTFLLGSPTDDWTTTHTWTAAEFGANFRARVRDIDPGTSCADTATTHLDWLRFNVLYTQPVTASQYALDAAAAAKGAGVNIFSIHYGDTSGQNFMGQLASPSTLPSVGITTASRAGTSVTITTASAHRLTANERVQVSGVSSATLNGTFTVTSTPSPNIFTYTTSGSGTVNATGGSVTPTNLFLSPSSSAMTGIFQSIGYQICPAAAASCSNGVDDDGDGVKDDADGGCHTDGNAGNPASYDPADTDEWTAPAAPTPPAPPPPPPTITIGSWVEIP